MLVIRLYNSTNKKRNIEPYNKTLPCRLLPVHVEAFSNTTLLITIDNVRSHDFLSSMYHIMYHMSNLNQVKLVLFIQSKITI